MENSVTVNHRVIRTTLPQLANPFMGRTQEVAELSDVLANPDCRLLTLTGPGGIGKTRLGLELAYRSQETFSDGAYFVPLAPVTDADSFIAAMTDALPFQPQDHKRDLLQELVEYLQEKQMLLVLDNFEHLMDEVSIVQQLLASTASVKLIVTSREMLNLTQEWARNIVGMDYPQNSNGKSLTEYSAIQLFLERAQRVRPSVSLDSDADDIIRICQLVEGMPLALELAAGWLSSLPLSKVVHEIEAGIDILKTRSRDVPSRHRSIRAVFDQSWDLLSDEEQDIFSKLSIFKGGFTAEAAINISSATLDTLADLVNKSLVTLNDNGRYDIHELLRQYAFHKLDLNEQTETIKTRHMAFYLKTLMPRMESGIHMRHQIQALNTVEADFDNIRQAWEYAIAIHDFEGLNLAVEALGLFSDMRNRFAQGSSMLKSATDEARKHIPESLIWARLQTRLIRVLMLGMVGFDFEPEVETEKALQIAERYNDAFEIGYSSHLFGVLIQTRRTIRPQMSVPQIHLLQGRALEQFRACGSPFYMAEVMAWYGIWLSFEDTDSPGMRMLEESLKIREEIEDSNGVAWALNNLAEALFYLNRYDEASDYLNRALMKMRALNSSKGISYTGLTLWRRLTVKGEFEEARKLAEELLVFTRESFPNGERQIYGPIGIIKALADEEYELARTYIEKSRKHLQRLFYVSVVEDSATVWGLLIIGCVEGDFSLLPVWYEKFTLFDFNEISTSVICLAMEAMQHFHNQRWTEATEYFGLVFSFPYEVTGWLDKWAFIVRVRTELENRLGATAFHEAWERGAQRDYVHEVLRIAERYGQNTRQQANQQLTEPLTERELEILALIADGLSNRDIAERLVVSVGTVKVHTRNLYGKLEVSSRTQAVVRATELALI